MVRAAERADAAAIAEIYRPIVERTTISFEETAPNAEDFVARITALTPAYPWLVASIDDCIVGYAYAARHRERSAYRYSADVSVYVGDGVRRRGVAAALYEELFTQLRQRGFHRAFAGVALPNDASNALHARFGFERVGVYREVGYKFGIWLDVLWWQKPLADRADVTREDTTPLDTAFPA